MPYKTKVDPAATALWLQRDETSAAARPIRLATLHPELAAAEIRTLTEFATRAGLAGALLGREDPERRGGPRALPLQPGTVGGTNTAVVLVGFLKDDKMTYRTKTIHTGRELSWGDIIVDAEKIAEKWMREGDTRLAGKIELKSVEIVQAYQS